MKMTINLTLLTAVMISTISTAVAAPASLPAAAKAMAGKQSCVGERNKTQKTTKKSSRWSFKAKAIAAASVVAAGIIAVIIYKLKNRQPGEISLDELFKFEQQAQPQQNVPAGRAGQLMQGLVHNPNYQQAMRNPASRANIEQLFHNEEFVALMAGRLGQYIEVQLPAIFNDAQILDVSAQADFAQRVIDRFNEVQRKIDR